MSEQKGEVTGTPSACHCYALILYKQPSIFAAEELTILKHGSIAEWNRVLFVATARMFGVPRSVIEADVDCNYSSARMDRHG
jgi:hypothetical protein